MIYSTTEYGERSMIILTRGTIVCVLYGGGILPACPSARLPHVQTKCSTNRLNENPISKQRKHTLKMRYCLLKVFLYAFTAIVDASYPRLWRFACSADLSKCLGTYHTDFKRSTDYGRSWSDVTDKKVLMQADCLFFRWEQSDTPLYNKYLWYSHDAGVTWTEFRNMNSGISVWPC